MVQPARGLRRVRQPGKQDRRAAKMEGAADAAESNREAVAVTQKKTAERIFAVEIRDGDDLFLWIRIRRAKTGHGACGTSS